MPRLSKSRSQPRPLKPERKAALNGHSLTPADHRALARIEAAGKIEPIDKARRERDQRAFRANGTAPSRIGRRGDRNPPSSGLAVLPSGQLAPGLYAIDIDIDPWSSEASTTAMRLDDDGRALLPAGIVTVLVRVEPFRLDLARRAFAVAHGAVNALLAGGLIRGDLSTLGGARGGRHLDPRPPGHVVAKAMNGHR